MLAGGQGRSGDGVVLAGVREVEDDLDLGIGEELFEVAVDGEAVDAGEEGGAVGEPVHEARDVELRVHGESREVVVGDEAAADNGEVGSWTLHERPPGTGTLRATECGRCGP